MNLQERAMPNAFAGKRDFAPETKAPEHPHTNPMPLCRDGVSIKNAAESGLFAGVFRLCDLPAV
jgi:hypothetical protein